MLIRSFKRELHEEWGTEGWLMIGSPSTFAPTLGLGVAHDVMEHGPNDNGSVEHELLAFGAALYIRGEGGYWAQKGSRYTPGEQVGTDIGGDLAFKYEGLIYGLQNPGRTTRLETHVEEWLGEMERESRKVLLEYLESYKANPTTRDISEYLTMARGWLRKGYRRAVRRYKNIGVCELAHLFAEIEKKADRLLEDEMATYCPLVVRLDAARCAVQVYLEESVFDEEEWN